MPFRPSFERPPEIERPLEIEVGGKRSSSPTHPGWNEDAILFNQRGFGAVFDGAGGHAAGEVASGIAQGSLLNVFDRLPDRGEPEKIGRILVKALAETSKKIFKEGQKDPKKRGMRTTAAVVKIVETPEGEKRAVCATVGDSRIYRLRKKKLEQVTLDDDLISKDFYEGKLEKKEVVEIKKKLDSFERKSELGKKEKFYLRRRRLITQSLGSKEEIRPHLNIVGVEGRDKFLICSDGVSDNLTKKEIAKILLSVKFLSDCVKRLIEQAKKVAIQELNDRAKLDDISAVVMKIKK